MTSVWKPSVSLGVSTVILYVIPPESARALLFISGTTDTGAHVTHRICVSDGHCGYHWRRRAGKAAQR